MFQIAGVFLISDTGISTSTRMALGAKCIEVLLASPDEAMG